MGEKLRIDKFLADMGIGTRSEIKNYVRKGLVAINGTRVRSASEKADISLDNVTYNGEEIQYLQYEYYLLNKPAGVISATEDKNTPTVIDLIKDKKRTDLFPVGRLDKDTEGLLLITNDGLLAHNLLTPGRHVDKTYYLKTDNRLTVKHAELIAQGLRVDEDFVAMPGVLDIISASDTGSEAYLTIHEGKFHQVKRMMEATGNTVTYLKRISMGPLTLPEAMAPGEYRKLEREELEQIRNVNIC